jgi:transketolase
MMATTAAGSGHPTSCMSAAELVAGTFFYAMKFDPKHPNSPDGDRFVLSKGHAAPVLYAALAEAGVFPESRVMTLREFSSELEGHPTPRIPGVDAATGSLGQGLSVGAGLAIGAKMDESPTRVYVMLGDGEMAEGQVWEAAAFAGHYKLENLTVLADVNALGQSEPTMYQHNMEIYRQKFETEDWAVEIIDGHDVPAVLAALDRAKATKGHPQAILARTIKGHGVSFLAGKEHWHGKPILPCRRYVTTQVLASIVAVHQFVFPGRAHHWPNKRLYGRLLKRLKDRGRIGFVTQPTAGCPGDRDSLAST